MESISHFLQNDNVNWNFTLQKELEMRSNSKSISSSNKQHIEHILSYRMWIWFQIRSLLTYIVSRSNRKIGFLKYIFQIINLPCWPQAEYSKNYYLIKVINVSSINLSRFYRS